MRVTGGQLKRPFMNGKSFTGIEVAHEFDTWNMTVYEDLTAWATAIFFLPHDIQFSKFFKQMLASLREVAKVRSCGK